MEASLPEAIDWVRRCPRFAFGEVAIRIRQVFAAEDFGAEFTPDCARGKSACAQLKH